MKIKLLVLHKDTPVGSIVEVDEKQGKELILNKTAIEYTEEIEKQEKLNAIKEKSMATEIEVKDIKVEQKAEDPMIIKSFGEWMQNITKDPNRIKLTQKASGMSEGVNADGGYLLTSQITSQIFGATIPGSVIYPKVFKLPIQSNSIKLPIFNDTGDSATSAPRMYPITPDGGSKTGTKPAITQKTLSLVTWSYLVYATEELLEDAPAFGAWIVQKIREKSGYDFDNLCFNGVAATNGFEGIGTAAANAYRAACTVAATITPQSVINLMGGIIPQYLDGAEWYMSPAAWKSMMYQCSVATAIQPSFGGMITDNGKTLMGKPVNIMPQLAALNSNGDIYLGNFGTFVVAEKNGLNIAISRDFKFDTDEVAYRVTIRQAGASTIPSKTQTDGGIQAAFAARF